MTRWSAAVFDMDGLLLDTERPALTTFLATCDDFGIGDQTPVFIRCVGANADAAKRALQEGLAGLADAEAFGKAWDERYHVELDAAPIALKPGVTETLRHFAALGLPLAVATSSRTQRAGQKLQAAGIELFFRVVVGGDQVTASKPAPDIYLRAASMLSVEPACCLAFEDSPNGVRAAVAAGMRVVQVPDLIEPDEELRGLGHLVLRRLDEVIHNPPGHERGA